VKKARILALCGDAGGAAAVAPVITRLREEGHEVIALAYAQAPEVWGSRKMPFASIPDTATTDTAIQERIRSVAPDILLVGTSVNGVDLEKAFTVAARHDGVPVLAVLDFWSNYAARFADEAGQLTALPNRIAVMDAQARDDMLQSGFPAEVLVVTGQPAFDDLAPWKKAFTDDDAAAVRAELGCDLEEKLVLFLSQPIKAFYGPDVERAGHPGFTEEDVFKLLVNGLDELACSRNLSVRLVVLRHPRETGAVWRAARAEQVKVQPAPEHVAVRAMLVASDLVAGMNTVLLVDACYLGCVTLALQPGLQTPDTLPVSRSGLCATVYDEQELPRVLASVLLDENVREAMRRRLQACTPPGGAAERVLSELLDLVDLQRKRKEFNHA